MGARGKEATEWIRGVLDELRKIAETDRKLREATERLWRAEREQPPPTEEGDK